MFVMFPLAGSMQDVMAKPEHQFSAEKNSLRIVFHPDDVNLRKLTHMILEYFKNPIPCMTVCCFSSDCHQPKH